MIANDQALKYVRVIRSIKAPAVKKEKEPGCGKGKATRASKASKESKPSKVVKHARIGKNKRSSAAAPEPSKKRRRGR